MPKTFNFMNERAQTEGMVFEKPVVKMKGQEIDWYAYIQEGREDTEIYETLEKYGCIDKMMLNTEGVYADLRNIKSMKDIVEQNIAANQMWENLPLDTRSEFNGSKAEFLERGEKWLKNKIDEKKAAEALKTEEEK